MGVGRRLLLAATIAAALLVGPVGAVGARPASVTARDWVQNGFDAADTHFNPHERVLTRANVGTLTPSWNLEADATGSPAVVGDEVFAQTKTAVNAYDRLTGALDWSHAVPSDLFFGSVAVDRGAVYAISHPSLPTETPIFFALSAVDGSVLWKLRLSHFSGNRSIVLADGDAYVSGGSGGEIVIDPATHRVARKLTAPSELTAPQVADGHVFAADISNHELYSFDEATGAREWHVSVGNDLLLSDDAVSDGVVVLPSKDGSVYAVDESDGSPLWSFPTATKFPGEVAIAKGVVYFGDYGGTFYALDLHTGTKRWSVAIGGQATDEPTVANGVVYLTANDKNLHALDARNGSSLYTFRTGVISDGNIVVANGNVFATLTTGRLGRWVLPD